MIRLKYGGIFNEHDLVNFIKASGRDYIIQGQNICTFAEHPKPQSLDYWLRRYATRPDTKQAENAVIEALVATGFFKKEPHLSCPDKGTSCKGLRLL